MRPGPGGALKGLFTKPTQIPIALGMEENPFSQDPQGRSVSFHQLSLGVVPKPLVASCFLPSWNLDVSALHS